MQMPALTRTRTRTSTDTWRLSTRSLSLSRTWPPNEAATPDDLHRMNQANVQGEIRFGPNLICIAKVNPRCICICIRMTDARYIARCALINY